MDVETLSPTRDLPIHTFKARKQRPQRSSRITHSNDNDNAFTSHRATSPLNNFNPSQAQQDDTASRTQHDDGDTPMSGNTQEDNLDDQNEQGMSMTEILRKRKLGRTRKGGLDFNTNRTRTKTPPIEDEAMMAEKDAVDQEVNAVVNRFTQQTGAMIDVDEHMMKYIERELEKRRIQSGQASAMDDLSDLEMERTFPAPLTSTKIAEKRIGKWPVRPDFRGATLGKLQEIDLGAENTKKNILRTEELKGRLERGESLALEGEGEDTRKRRRGKRRRNSLDIVRDKLVEEVLKESRYIYEEPEPNNGQNDGDDEEDHAADDRIAEQFRREFLDALNARRRGRNNQNKKKEDLKRPRGPKLGGSRAARAAMRESERAKKP